jgi:PAS domain S-box-containing protein
MEKTKPSKARRSDESDASSPGVFRSPLFWKSYAFTLLPSLLLLAIFLAIVLVFVGPLVNRRFIAHRQEQSINLSMVARSVLDEQRRLQLDGAKSLEVAQSDALKLISALRYNQDHSGYFWVQDGKGIILAHPMIPSLAGKTLESVEPRYRDVLAMVMKLVPEVVASGQGAFVRYRWYRDLKRDATELKYSYMSYYPPWEWVIGTGMYVSDIKRDINDFLFWIVFIGMGLGVASFALSLFFSWRVTKSRVAFEAAQGKLDESRNEVKAKEEQFETIFNTSLYATNIVSMETNAFIRVNEAFCRLTGYPAEEIIGRDAIQLGIMSKEEGYEYSRKFREIVEVQKRPFENVPYLFRTKSGEARNVLVSAVPVLIRGKPHIVSTIADMTETLRLQEQLTQSQKMDTVGQLAGGIAHDFNNMLTGILGSAEVLGMELGANDQSKKWVDVIINAAERASELTSKLLVFSRRGKIVSTSVDIHDTIKAAISLLGRSIDKSIEIRAELGAERSLVSGDPALIQNALLNLGINARDAMPEGGVLTFSTSNAVLDGAFLESNGMQIREGEFLVVKIRDTGTGIPKDILPKIFDPFFTTKPAGQGTGLGLSAVYGTVKEHQGTVTVYSELGLGSEFKIYLPVSAQNAQRAAKPDEPIRGKGKILVVDDESVIRNTAFGMLNSLGYDVMLAPSGRAGIEIYRENRQDIDLVILDMVMPEMNGRETFARMRAEFPDSRIVFSSGFSPESAGSSIKSLGAEGFIQKPYSMASLGATVAACIRRR